MAGGVNTNLLFKWRRDHLRAMRTPRSSAAMLLPVQLSPPPSDVAATSSHERDDVFDLGSVRLRLRSTVSKETLVTVLRVLRRSA